jgi:hypothetical protein
VSVSKCRCVLWRTFNLTLWLVWLNFRLMDISRNDRSRIWIDFSFVLFWFVGSSWGGNICLRLINQGMMLVARVLFSPTRSLEWSNYFASACTQSCCEQEWSWTAIDSKEFSASSACLSRWWYVSLDWILSIWILRWQCCSYRALWRIDQSFSCRKIVQVPRRYSCRYQSASHIQMTMLFQRTSIRAISLTWLRIWLVNWMTHEWSSVLCIIIYYATHVLFIPLRFVNFAHFWRSLITCIRWEVINVFQWLSSTFVLTIMNKITRFI